MKGEYKGEFDNLLFYFSYTYNLIQQEYRQGDKLFPRKDDYVQLIGGNEGKAPPEPKEGRKRRGKRANKKEPPPPKKQKTQTEDKK